MPNPPVPRPAYLTSREACARLGIKPATLYAYASRGQIHVVPGRGPRASLYLALDVERLRDRSRAKLAQGPIASAALNFGEPVLETSLVLIAQDTLYYRGKDVLGLCRDDAPFESVAELLWTGAPIDAPVTWRLTDRHAAAAMLRSRDPGDVPAARLRRAVAAAACATEKQEAVSREQELAAARDLILAFVKVIDPAARVFRSADDGVPIAVQLARNLRIPEPQHKLLNKVLVLIAEHELNASSFVARVASSTRASLYACVEAALAAHSGTHHGGYSLLVETQLARLRSIPAARAWVRETLSARKHLLGFGQPLYPDGDPRTPILLGEANLVWPGHPELKRVAAIQEEAEEMAQLRPNVDFALAVLARLWNLPPGTIGAVFAIGRCAGWVAHILEQRNSSVIIRPRAKYVGP